jgi:hypothetical protein
MTQLTDFLGLGSPSTLKLCMSRFDRAEIDSGHAPPGFRYPSYAFAERDVRSAYHVQRLAADAGADIDFISPDELAGEIRSRNSWMGIPATVVFGSRSNMALADVLGHSPLGQLVKFEFGESWTIRTRDNKTYSLRDPSGMSNETYAAQTDYGIVGRATESGRSHFVVAGLGGRATEGCGLYLQRNWAMLAGRAADRPFVALLQFDPPVDPAVHKLVEFITLP